MRLRTGDVSRRSATFLSCVMAIALLAACGPKRDQAGSSTDLRAPFKVTDAYVREWLGGSPGSGRGWEFYLQVDSLDQGIVLDSVYFGQLSGSLRVKGADSISYWALLKTGRPPGLDMEAQTLKESGNLPVMRLKTGLETARALIFFTAHGKQGYKLIEGVRQAEAVAYPSAPAGDKQ